MRIKLQWLLIKIINSQRFKSFMHTPWHPFDYLAGEAGSSLIRVTDFGENITYWISTKESEEIDKWRVAFKKERQIVASESINGKSLNYFENIYYNIRIAIHIGYYYSYIKYISSGYYANET